MAHSTLSAVSRQCSAAIDSEALLRARSGQSSLNLRDIYEGFTAKGIALDDIIPRENVLTFAAWRAAGRQVRKGVHGVQILTWIPIPEKTDEKTGEITPAGRRPKTATVFHISQTDPRGVK